MSVDEDRSVEQNQLTLSLVAVPQSSLSVSLALFGLRPFSDARSPPSNSSLHQKGPARAAIPAPQKNGRICSLEILLNLCYFIVYNECNPPL